MNWIKQNKRINEVREIIIEIVIHTLLLLVVILVAWLTTSIIGAIPSLPVEIRMAEKAGVLASTFILVRFIYRTA